MENKREANKEGEDDCKDVANEIVELLTGINDIEAKEKLVENYKTEKNVSIGLEGESVRIEDYIDITLEELEVTFGNEELEEFLTELDMMFEKGLVR